MVLQLLLGIGALMAGAAAGYGLVKLIESLSESFARLWGDLVKCAQSLFGYVAEATRYFFARLSQLMEENWPEIEEYLFQQIGYFKEWLVGIYAESGNLMVIFSPPTQIEKVAGISIRLADQGSDIQLPTTQNPLVTELVLTH